MKCNKFQQIIKKSISVIMAVMLLVSCTASAVDNSKQATPTSSKIYVNGHEAYINGYNIEYNNYFKLRDLAAVLAGTESQFNVSYDSTQDLITITRGLAPESLFVLVEENKTIKSAQNTESKITVDGTEVNPQGYNIDYNNYFKLRDLGAILGFNVEWNEQWDSIYITTTSNTELDYNNYRSEIPNFDEINQVVYLVNCEREKYGLPPLIWDLNITKAALKRSEEIVDVFSHTRPNGEDCFTIFKEFGIDYMAAGENIAIGQKTPEKVVKGWMESPGHRENILSGNFGRIGVGAVKVQQGAYQGYAWVQLFAD